MTTDAYDSGRRAYNRNLLPYSECKNQNPYELYSNEWADWVLGFEDAYTYDYEVQRDAEQREG